MAISGIAAGTNETAKALQTQQVDQVNPYEQMRPEQIGDDIYQFETMKTLFESYVSEAAAQNKTNQVTAVPLKGLETSQIQVSGKVDASQTAKGGDLNAAPHEIDYAQNAYNPALREDLPESIPAPSATQLDAFKTQQSVGAPHLRFYAASSPLDAFKQSVHNFRTHYQNEMQEIHEIMGKGRNIEQVDLIRIQSKIAAMNVNTTIFINSTRSAVDSLRQLLAAQ